MSNYGRYDSGNARKNPNRPTGSGHGQRTSQSVGSRSGSSSTRSRVADGRVQSRSGYSQGGRGRNSSSNRIMEDERARIRARERKKRRRRRRKMILMAFVLLILFLIGGIVYGLMRHNREKKRQELLREGIELLNEEKYEEAVKQLDDALQWSKDNIGEFETNVLLYRADAEFRLQDYDAALNTYELLCKSDEENTDYKKGAARCMVEKGDYDAALALGVIDGYIYNLKAVEQIRAGEYDAALELIEKGIAAGDSLQDLTFNEAVAWENKGDFAKALELFETYAVQYGADENVERELIFLRSRQGNSGEDSSGSPAFSENEEAAETESSTEAGSSSEQTEGSPEESSGGEESSSGSASAVG